VSRRRPSALASLAALVAVACEVAIAALRLVLAVLQLLLAAVACGAWWLRSRGTEDAATLRGARAGASDAATLPGARAGASDAATRTTGRAGPSNAATRPQRDDDRASTPRPASCDDAVRGALLGLGFRAPAIREYLASPRALAAASRPLPDRIRAGIAALGAS
jgi:hypothetical protein